MLKHFIHMQYFQLVTSFFIVFVHSISTGVLYELRQCSLFWDNIPESEIYFCINLHCLSAPHTIRPIQTLFNCQTMRWVPLSSSGWGATKTVPWLLSLQNNIISIHQGSAHANEGKQRRFKVIISWMVYVLHHVHDGHCTGEFTTIIWRLHSFTVSFCGDVHRESGLRQLAEVNRRAQQWARGQFTKTIMPACFEKWRDIKFGYIC